MTDGPALGCTSRLGVKVLGSGGPQSEQDPWGRQGMGTVWAGPAAGKASGAAAPSLPGQE